MISDVRICMPKLLEKPITALRVHFLCQPTTVCLLGCSYVNGDSRELIAHRDATEVAVYGLLQFVGIGYEYTLRCGGCKSRYSYAMYFNRLLKTVKNGSY
ncbi:hypothetical protein BV898_19125, partial [Hypsibius exemplaris]